MTSHKKIVIESAIALNQSQIESIIQNTKVAKDSELEVKVNPQLIGGIKVSYNGKVFDASLRHNIDQLRTYLTHEE